MRTSSRDTVFIRHLEEVKQNYSYNPLPPSELLDFLIFHAYASFLVEFKLVAEVTRYSSALLEYKVHNLSLSSDSRQDLQLNPKSIPSIHVEPRHSYQFRLPANYIIL